MALMILSILSEGLKFINGARAQEIGNRVIELREQFNEELSKGADRDDARLDMLERELFDLGNVFLSAVKSAAPPS